MNYKEQKEELIFKGLCETIENGYDWPNDLENISKMDKKAFAKLRWNDHRDYVVKSENGDEVSYDHILGEISIEDSWNLLKEAYRKNDAKIIEEDNLIDEKEEKENREKEKDEKLLKFEEEKLKEEGKCVDDKKEEDEKNKESEDDTDDEKYESKGYDNEEGLNQGDKIQKLGGNLTYEQESKDMEKENKAKGESDKFRHENKKVSKAYIILNKPNFQVMFSEMTDESEIWKAYKEIGLIKNRECEVMKECKGRIYDSCKIYDTETRRMLERLVYVKSYCDQEGRYERDKARICKLVLKISTFGKKVDAMKKVWIISLFLPKHVKYKDYKYCLESQIKFKRGC